MATFNFDQFLDAVKNGVGDLAKTEGVDYIEAARSDGQDFLNAIKHDLVVWMQQLTDGLLSQDEFEFLVNGKRDLAKMEALTQAGVGAAKVDKIRSGAINIVLTSALALI